MARNMIESGIVHRSGSWCPREQTATGGARGDTVCAVCRARTEQAVPMWPFFLLVLAGAGVGVSFYTMLMGAGIMSYAVFGLGWTGFRVAWIVLPLAALTVLVVPRRSGWLPLALVTLAGWVVASVFLVFPSGLMGL